MKTGSGGNRLFGRLHALETTIAGRARATGERSSTDTSAFRKNSRFIEQHPLDGPGGHGAHHVIGIHGESPPSAVPFSGPRIANTTVSNVPGPSDPIFFAGARLLRVTGLGPLIGGMNLFHIIASYNGTISIGVTADRKRYPTQVTTPTVCRTRSTTCWQQPPDRFYPVASTGSGRAR